jgi:hypothetical protein
MRRPTHNGAGGFQKKFADRIRELRHREPDKKPLKVVAFDEARFDLINWHRRRR